MPTPVRIIGYLDRQGKTFRNSVEHPSKYLIFFPEAYYLSNSQTYVIISSLPNAGSYLVMKMSKIA